MTLSFGEIYIQAVHINLTDKKFDLLPGDMIVFNDEWFGDMLDTATHESLTVDDLLAHEEKTRRFRIVTIVVKSMVIVLESRTMIEHLGYRRCWHVMGLLGSRLIRIIIFETKSNDDRFDATSFPDFKVYRAA